MANKNLQKLLKANTSLDAAELTADEKKALYAFLEGHGMPTSTAYLRIFDKGFDEWELRGIDDIKREFICENNIPQLNGVGDGFYSALTLKAGMKIKLVNKPAVMGMEHRNTVDRRFDADDWKPWERIGIRNLIATFTRQ